MADHASISDNDSVDSNTIRSITDLESNVNSVDEDSKDSKAAEDVKESNNNNDDENGNPNNNDDTLNSKRRITENLPKLLNIFGEYIQVHEKTEKFKSLGYFNLIIGSMWTELEPRFGVDPYDKPRIESLQRTFGVTAVGRKPNIMVNSICKPENEGFIKKLIRTRINTITVELNDLKYNSDSLYTLRLKQQMKILQDNLSRINNLPDESEECMPTTTSSVQLPTIFTECVDCDIMKNLVDLVNIMVNGDDKEVLDAIMDDTCTNSGKLDQKKKEEVLQTLKSLIDKYGLTGDKSENGDNGDNENGDENNENNENNENSNNGNNSESLRELWEEIRALASENKIDIEDVDDPQKANILEAISRILDKMDAYKNRSYRLLVARLQEKLKGKEQEYAAEIQNLSLVCKVSIDDCAKGLEDLYEKILQKKGTGDKKLDTILQEKDKTITKLQGDIAELKLKLALSLSGSKPGRNLEAELAAVTARLRAAEQEKERATEAADAARAAIERERADAERERAAAIAERDRAAVVLSNAETRHRTTLEEQLALANRRLDEANARFHEVNNQLTAISIEGARNIAGLNERLRATEQERERLIAFAEAGVAERERALEAAERDRAAALEEMHRVADELALAEGRARTILEEQLALANRRLDEANARILAITTDTGSRDTIARLNEELLRCREENRLLEEDNDDLYDRNLKFFEENSRLKTKLNEFNNQIRRLTRQLASFASGASGYSSRGTSDENSISNDSSINDGSTQYNESSNEEGEGATILLDYINILLDYAIMPIDKNLFLPEGSNTDILSIFDFNRTRDEKREYKDLGALLKEIFYGKNPKYSDIFQNYGIAGSSEEIELIVVTPYLKEILNSRQQDDSPYVKVEEDNVKRVTDFFENTNDIFFITGIFMKDGKMFIKRCDDIEELANNGWITSDKAKTEPKNKFMPLRFLIIRFIQLWKKFNPSRNGLGRNPYIEGLVMPGDGRSRLPSGTGMPGRMPGDGRSRLPSGTGMPGDGRSRLPSGPGVPGREDRGTGLPGREDRGTGLPGLEDRMPGDSRSRLPSGTGLPGLEDRMPGDGISRLPSGIPSGDGRGLPGGPISLLCTKDFKVILSADKGKKKTDRAESIKVTPKIYGKKPENPTYEWKRNGEILPDTTDQVTLITTEPIENIEVVCTVKYKIGETQCEISSPPLSLYLKKGRATTPTRILSQGSRPSQRPSRVEQLPPFITSVRPGIPNLPISEPLTVGDPKIWEPIDTHSRTIINIIIMLQSSPGTIPQALKVNLEKHGKSGIIDKNSPIYKFFIENHRTQWDIISKYKSKKGDTTLSLIHILEEESPTELTDEQIQIQESKTNPNDTNSIPYKYKQLFNRIFDGFDQKYGARACRIYIKFLYDLIVGYSLTYGHDRTTEVAIDYYYKHIFKYYIGKKSIECLKIQGLNTEDKVIASLISYANNEDIPFLKRGGGEDDELIDFGSESIGFDEDIDDYDFGSNDIGDKQLIDLDIDDE